MSGGKFILAVFIALSIGGTLLGSERTYMGIAVFPDAEEVAGFDAGDKGIDLGMKTYQARASFDKVVTFYKKALPDAMFSSVQDKGERGAVFQIIEGESVKMITVSENEEGKVVIGIMKRQ